MSYVRSRAETLGLDARLPRPRSTSTSTSPRARSPRTGRRPGITMATALVVGAAAHPGAPGRRDDRRDHAARPRAADRRAQGEDPRGAPRGHHDRAHPRGEREGPQGHPQARCSKQMQIDPGRAHGRGAARTRWCCPEPDEFLREPSVSSTGASRSSAASNATGATNRRACPWPARCRRRRRARRRRTSRSPSRRRPSPNSQAPARTPALTRSRSPASANTSVGWPAGGRGPQFLLA